MERSDSYQTEITSRAWRSLPRVRAKPTQRPPFYDLDTNTPTASAERNAPQIRAKPWSQTSPQRNTINPHIQPNISINPSLSPITKASHIKWNPLKNIFAYVQKSLDNLALSAKVANLHMTMNDIPRRHMGDIEITNLSINWCPFQWFSTNST